MWMLILGTDNRSLITMLTDLPVNVSNPNIGAHLQQKQDVRRASRISV